MHYMSILTCLELVNRMELGHSFSPFSPLPLSLIILSHAHILFLALSSQLLEPEAPLCSVLFHPAYPFCTNYLLSSFSSLLFSSLLFLSESVAPEVEDKKMSSCSTVRGEAGFILFHTAKPSLVQQTREQLSLLIDLS